jgi:hypothetical protein
MVDIPPRPIAAWANGSRADSAAQGAVTGAGLHSEIRCGEGWCHSRMAKPIDIQLELTDPASLV